MSPLSRVWQGVSGTDITDITVITNHKASLQPELPVATIKGVFVPDEPFFLDADAKIREYIVSRSRDSDRSAMGYYNTNCTGG